MRRIFCVQPYRLKRHKLVAAGAAIYDDRAVALAAGRELARRRAGVVVLEQQLDGVAGAHGKPMVLAVHGRVPSSWDSGQADLLAA